MHWTIKYIVYRLEKLQDFSDQGKETKSFLIRPQVREQCSKKGYLCPSSNKI